VTDLQDDLIAALDEQRVVTGADELTKALQ